MRAALAGGIRGGGGGRRAEKWRDGSGRGRSRARSAGRLESGPPDWIRC